MKYIFFISLLWLTFSCSQQNSFKVKVEKEESVYRYEPANNGAGPMWTHGNTCIVRYRNKVFASGLQTLKDVPPLNNTRWLLFERNDKGWKLLLADPKERTREPCPLGLMRDGRLFLSVNPSIVEPGVKYGPTKPQILQFDAEHPQRPYKILEPVWDGEPPFMDHSYRSFAVDSENGEMIIFQNIGYGHAEWSFMDKSGKWSRQGKLIWPPADYKDEQDHDVIRVCYPAVQLKNKKVYFLGVSDIQEPNKVWRDYKFKLTNRKWDYDFRRLFYTWSKDISTGRFEKWVEVSSRDKTGGNIFPADLWEAPDGQIYVLWYERALDERLKEKFFPQEKQSESLNFAIIKDGKVVFRKAVMTGGPGDVTPGKGRFQVTEDNRLFVFYYVHGGPDDIKENRIAEISLNGNHAVSEALKVDVERPLSNFYTANVRAGSAPSSILEVYGKDKENEMRDTIERIEKKKKKKHCIGKFSGAEKR